MPLGIFGSSGKDSGPKPQPLTSEEKVSKKEKTAGTSNNAGAEIKDSKGSTVKLWKKSYTVERKLAEGGFAIVYLVTDKHNRNYALKRQLIRDDPRQVEACRTESQIVKNLNGHKNIVAYVDHQLTVNKAGVYDYMLLTIYYPDNVLQLMNSRLLVNKWLTQTEILDIFCDVCEAVARLHHSKTPVIHRDLKVENVLIDRRSGAERPQYILCDFGSATTKVLSKEHYTHAFMEEEIQRYTTLSYRAPEMVDLFSGVPIDTKSDIWALGILLYKLCFFSLPFGESALAIQSGLFTFPEVPQIPDGIKAIINLMLTLSAKHRPNIYQTSYLAFSAANRKCPIFNIEKSARIELNEAIQILHLRARLGTNYSRLFEKAINDFEAQKRRHTIPADNQQTPANKSPHQTHPAENIGTAHQFDNSADSPSTSAGVQAAQLGGNGQRPLEGVIVSTNKEFAELHPRTGITSVNPRLRPKPVINTHSAKKPTNREDVIMAATTTVTKTAQNESTQPSEQSALHEQVDCLQRVISQTMLVGDGQQQESPAGLKHLSAFQPYSLAKEKRVHNTSTTFANSPGEHSALVFESSNPFVQLPGSSTAIDLNMDDNMFGEHFDAIRRDRIHCQEESQSTKEQEASQEATSNELFLEYPANAATFQMPQRVQRDWALIEERIGDDPFKNAPQITPSQHFKQ